MRWCGGFFGRSRRRRTDGDQVRLSYDHTLFYLLSCPTNLYETSFSLLVLFLFLYILYIYFIL